MSFHLIYKMRGFNVLIPETQEVFHAVTT